jgi:tetratricopeptide (TPR) repeat protein
MANHPPNLQGGPGAAALPLPAGTVETLLGQALAAHKAGTLDDWLRRRPRATRWFVRRFLQPVLGTAGDALPRDRALVEATALWLRWVVSQLRPDQASVLSGIDAAAWVDRTSWRPMLALMCHYGFEPVPDFRQRYRRHPDEAASENLCGLWAIGPSTFYRYLEKGKRLAAEALLERPAAGERRIAMRQMVLRELLPRLELASPAELVDWHRRQSTLALAQQDTLSALWHLQQASAPAAFIELLQRARVDVADDAETDALIALVAAGASDPRQRFDLLLAQAALWRIRDAGDRERQAYEQALRLANGCGDALMLGIVYGALGKFYEPRDADRAFACYEDSAEFLRRAGLEDGRPPGAAVAEEYLATLVKLAWLYVLRNDPRSRAVLDRAEPLRRDPSLSPATVGMLEQTWGEYWRRAGDLRRALEHKHRALNIFEREGDRLSVLKTYANLSLIYGDAKDFDSAIAYSQRILGMAGSVPIEPETLTSTHLNLGATYFWQGRYGEAIAEYRQALAMGEQAGLSLHVRRAHYNLAEAHYKRYQLDAQPDDESQGDAHAAAALKVSPGDSDPAHLEATRNLKTEILGPRDGAPYDRLLPEEFAAHFDEMAQIQRHRAVLAVPMGAEAHVRARLAIANAYLAMSSKEREAALQLIQKHGLGDGFAAEFEQLRSTFNRELTREQQLATQWEREAGELLQEQRRIAVLEHLFRAGSIQKSIYAQVCGVGLATASKHLATLAERGLLEQTGKGPSTRYVLPG